MEKNIVLKLVEKGVHIPMPDTVFVSDTVNPDRISGENVIIYPGCRLYGAKTLICQGSQVGYETPVTIENVIIGRNVRLLGGFFKSCVFWGENVFGSGAHVREGTILEEEANAAHTVGLKQTVLFPFVTLGSLINFCDCFMAGGTSRKNHSEVGSSFIHFNYTPNQDKATASMIGDLVQGLMLDKNPIFLGGQGGVVGPLRLAYGCLSAAGSILRKDELKENRLLLGGGFKNVSFPRQKSIYTDIVHIYSNNIYYIASMTALRQWYLHVRKLFVRDDMDLKLCQGALACLDSVIVERVKRFLDFGKKLEISRSNLEKDNEAPDSKLMTLHIRAIEKMSQAQQIFDQSQDAPISDTGQTFIETLKQKGSAAGYVATIQSLSDEEKNCGIQWMTSIVDPIVNALTLEQE